MMNKILVDLDARLHGLETLAAAVHHEHAIREAWLATVTCTNPPPQALIDAEASTRRALDTVASLGVIQTTVDRSTLMVGKPREILDGMPDNTPVPDHSYRSPSAGVASVMASVLSWMESERGPFAPMCYGSGMIAPGEAQNRNSWSGLVAALRDTRFPARDFVDPYLNEDDDGYSSAEVVNAVDIYRNVLAMVETVKDEE